jgi:uncharacterized protein (DUF736 family)
MATTIGTFTNRDGKITGKIRSLPLGSALTFLPNENPTRADASSYRIFAANKSEVGPALEKTAEATGRKYLPFALTILPSPDRSTPRCSNRKMALTI